MHERDRDDRAHRGLALGQVGARAATALRATLEDTTLCDEPVSTTKLRRGPPAKRTATPSDTSPGVGVTVSGTVVPRPPRQRGRRRAPRPACNGEVPAQRRPLGPGQDERPGGEVDAHRAEAGEDVGAERGRSGSPFPPIWGSVAAVSCWGAKVTPSSDHDPDATGVAVPVQPTPANSVAGPADGQVQPVGQAGVDGRLPRPGVEDEGDTGPGRRCTR